MAIADMVIGTPASAAEDVDGGVFQDSFEGCTVGEGLCFRADDGGDWIACRCYARRQVHVEYLALGLARG